MNGTIGVDMVRMIQTFAKGMYVNVKKVAPSQGIKDEPDYGFCTATIGRLNMSVEDMNENLTVILDALNQNAPKRKDKSGLITRVQAYVLPNGVVSAPKAYHFSIQHPTIYDTRLEEQEKVIQEGMEEIAKNVEKLKSSWTFFSDLRINLFNTSDKIVVNSTSRNKLYFMDFN